MPNVGYATLQIIPSVRGIGNDLRRQLVGPAGDAGSDAGEAAGGGFKDVFQGALAAIGVAEIASKIGEQFTEAFNDALEQADVTNTLAAQLGASGKDASRYGAAVGRLYARGVTENFEQGAEVLRSVVNAGLVPPDATNKQLDSIATKMSDVANVFGTDMSLQTQAVSALLKNGLAPSASSALDTITVGLQKLGPNAEDLLETFQEYPIQLKKLGLDATTAMGLFSQGLKGGARDTDIVADALKEFSIRSIDMSAGSRAAYKSLGLDAKTLEAQIGKGGDSARAGLQTVLDKLRDMHDPVKREAAAVGLFGTQAEELGTSLFKLDPGKATKTFSDVGGAATRLGKTIRSGPSYEITIFQRTLKQGLVNFIGGQVLPVLTRWGRVFTADVLPPLRIVGSVLSAAFLPTLRIVGSVLSGTINWFREWGIWLAPLAVLIAGVTLALNAQAIATGLVTAVFSVYRAAMLVGTAVTQGFAAAQALLNSVMALNPFVLIAIAVVALGVALVVAWKKSETFRDIVMGAWEGIKTAALYTWNNVLKPVVAALVVGWKAIAAGALWLWNTVLKPVFGFISTAARIIATIYVTVLLVAFKVWWTGVKFYFNAVAAIAVWLWKSVLSPVIGFIVAGFQLWWAGVKLYFGLIMAGFRAVGAAAVWLYQVAIAPVVALVVAGVQLMWAGVKVVFAYFMLGLRTVGGWFKWLYTNAVKPVVGWVRAGAVLMWAGVNVVFGYFKAGLRAVGALFTWLWRKAISPAIAGVRSVLSTTYNTGIKPVIDAFKGLIRGLGGAFTSAVSAIKKAWDRVKTVARAPVDFVVNTVYNRGIVGTWNKVASAFGAPKLSKYKFATGGPVFGAGTETSDDVPAWLSRNEHVWTAKEVRGAGGHGAVMALRKWAASGGASGGTPGFAKGGGLFGWVGSAASKGVDLVKSGVSWLKDGIKASALAGLNQIVKPLINKISGSASLYKDMITKVPKKMLSSIFSFSDEADKKLEKAGIGGKGFRAGLAWARTQAGKKYQWGGNGDPSWDCSGLVSAIESVIRGQRPHRRWATGAFSGDSAPPGWVHNARSPYMIGITNRGVGHTAGTINGVNVESRGGDGVVIGSRARGYRNSLFTDIYGFKGYAKGTRGATPGWAWVGELGPELVRFGGGEEVLNHRDSLRAAGGMGALPGYAKGTSAKARAAARKQVPGDLTGVTKALTASASDIKKAFDELTKDLKTTGGAAKSLATSSSKASTKLQALAKDRDKAAARLATAKEAASDQKKTAADFLGLSNLSGVTSIPDLITGLKSRQDTVKSFQSQIAKLSKKGLSQSLIQQLVALGPDSTLAGVVAGAGKGQIAQLNALAKSGGTLSTSYGNTMADLMYDAGANASKGFLTGLQSQEKALQAQMNKLGAGLVSSIKKKLKIKSPSRVTRWVGQMTGAGVGLGLDDTAATVAASAARLSEAAVPDVPRVSPATVAAATAARSTGLAPGTPLRLVVRDGTEFEAYIDGRAEERVAAGFRQVRRAVKAGK